MNTLQRQSSMNSMLFHTSNMAQPEPEYPTHDDTGYHTGGYDNVGSESESETEENPVWDKEIAPAVGLIKPKPKKRKLDPLDESIKGIKRLCTNADMIARVQSFFFSLEEEKRKALGDEIHWQPQDDTANRAALLDDTNNVIMQARKALMSRDNEGIKITIEQGGWHDPKTRIRPKYCINIERVKV